MGIALREDKFKAAHKLLNHPLLDVNIGAGIFSSIMHLAVVKQEVLIVEQLISKGSDVNAVDANTGDTPLHLLMNVYSKNSNNSRSILMLLTQSGIDLNKKN